MTDLHQIFDSTVGFLIGMALIEVVIKPLVVFAGKKTLKVVDRAASVPDWVIPDWLYDELPSEREYDC